MKSLTDIAKEVLITLGVVVAVAGAPIDMAHADKTETNHQNGRLEQIISKVPKKDLEEYQSFYKLWKEAKAEQTKTEESLLEMVSAYRKDPKLVKDKDFMNRYEQVRKDQKASEARIRKYTGELIDLDKRHNFVILRYLNSDGLTLNTVESVYGTSRNVYAALIQKKDKEKLNDFVEKYQTGYKKGSYTAFHVGFNLKKMVMDMHPELAGFWNDMEYKSCALKYVVKAFDPKVRGDIVKHYVNSNPPQNK